MQTDVSEELSGSNPTIKNSFLSAIIKSLAGRYNEFYGQLDLLEQRLLLLNSEDDFLDAWGSVFRITRNSATNATGNIIISGDVGTNIPASTEFQSSEGNQYTSTSSVNITAYNQVGVLNVTGLTVTVTLSSHGLASGMQVQVVNASNPALGGTFTITVIDANSFIYTITDSIGDGNKGNANIVANFATVSVKSSGFGLEYNLVSGSILTLTNAISGLDNNAYTSLGGISGGADVESDESYRSRILFRVRNPISDTSISGLENILYAINGITRVWVLPITPAIGQCTIYYVRDGEDDIFPSPTDITSVRAKIPTPAYIQETDIIVDAPTEQSINFTFASISPDTFSMRKAIEDSLKQFFEESIDIGAKLSPVNTITENQYIKPILNAVDSETGLSLTDFTLNSPSGSITVANANLPTLGTITFL
ncbi:baseplate J/gp47 family protein [Fangia hongkongensis]|uniref:baseplate J/gp47 family protein n=2 Tax=Fangia hongkongensis TaxID=270495 RepID=UPI00146B19C3|nr:baseplate J/gp47 family protein [Fangia hongkongensis]